MCLSVASRASPSQISPMGGNFLVPKVINKFILQQVNLAVLSCTVWVKPQKFVLHLLRDRHGTMVGAIKSIRIVR